MKENPNPSFNLISMETFHRFHRLVKLKKRQKSEKVEPKHNRQSIFSWQARISRGSCWLVLFQRVSIFFIRELGLPLCLETFGISSIQLLTCLSFSHPSLPSSLPSIFSPACRPAHFPASILFAQHKYTTRELVECSSGHEVLNFSTVLQLFSNKTLIRLLLLI